MKNRDISDEARGFEAGVATRSIWLHLLLEAAGAQGADIEKIAREALTSFGSYMTAAQGGMEKPADFVRFMEEGVGKEIFATETIQSDDDLAILRINYCPFVEAWKEYGLSPERIEKLCCLTQYNDHGRFDDTPLKLEITSSIGKGDSYCQFNITPKK